MFRNWTKKSSIIYLVGGVLLFVGLFLVSFVLVIWADGQSQYELTELQKLGISALGGFIPPCIIYRVLRRLYKNKRIER